ncbi:MAG TPA: hypothetical protein CFH81_02160 [Sulfurovum sp. UBA12169]|nr:MAG TPA: hypothetical protein CFH81_02160 [Sulfurovum sp. UBA12169]
MKLKAKRTEVKFEWEYADGSSAQLSYLEPTTEQIDTGIAAVEKGASESVKFSKQTLKENLRGEESSIERMLSELETSGNAYDVKGQLDEAVGNAKKRK